MLLFVSFYYFNRALADVDINITFVKENLNKKYELVIYFLKKLLFFFYVCCWWWMIDDDEEEEEGREEWILEKTPHYY